MSGKNLQYDLENKLKLDGSISSKSRIARRENMLREKNKSSGKASRAETSRSTSPKNKSYGGDRYMPKLNSDAVAATETSDPVMETIRNTFQTPSNILSFSQRPRVANPGGLAPKIMLSSSKSGLKSRSKRHIPKDADKIMDAPNLTQDYYCNVIHWNDENILAVALGNDVYCWNSLTGDITKVEGLKLAETKSISCVHWIDYRSLAISDTDGVVRLWDIEKQKQMRKLNYHAARVGCMSVGGEALPWILSTGSKSGEIINFDVRQASPVTSKYNNHTQEVTGLSWSPSGKFLASGGNDNLVNIWSDDVGHNQTRPLHELTEHMASVKALAWCPWKAQVLATGGGTADKKVKLWNCGSGAKVAEFDTENQVAGIHWNQEYREIVTAGGYPNSVLRLWKYPKFTWIQDLEGHDDRIFSMTMSPCGQRVATVAGDEQLRIWECFASTRVSKTKQVEKSTSITATSIR